MKTVFDLGMFDGADSAYYLDRGFRVVAVEANPALVERANERFAAERASGRFICIHAAISASNDPVTLTIGRVLSSSSTRADWLADNQTLGRISVPGLTMAALLEQHGTPYFLKVDIEGADSLAVLGLTSQRCPAFLSFEAGEDVERLIEHAAAIGFTWFKVINQVTFRELANQGLLRDRIGERVLRLMGYGEPTLLRRAGRFFVSGHSSGPGPWESDGRWSSAGAVVDRLRRYRAAGHLNAWYDIHAAARI